MTPSIHDLNTVCAEFVGREVFLHADAWFTWIDGKFVIWNPCQDHNQMSAIEQVACAKYTCIRYEIFDDHAMCRIDCHEPVEAETRLIALALAILELGKEGR